MLKMVYVHVPKTGGTRLNFSFSQMFSGYVGHLEQIPREDWPLQTFVGGHVRWADIRDSIEDSAVVSVITLREPFAWLKSHLAMLVHIHSLPLEAKRWLTVEQVKLCQDLASIDWSNLNEIESFVAWILQTKESELLRDGQLLYLLTDSERKLLWQEEGAESALESAIVRLNSFSVIGTTDNLSAVVADVAKRFRRPYTSSVPIANVRREDFALAIEDLAVRGLLLPLIRFDQGIYEVALAIVARRALGAVS